MCPKRTGEYAAPDWPYWGLLPTVTLWEAVALSLNLDPREFEPHPAGGRPAGIAVVRIPPPEFYRRLDLARRCIGETLPAAKPRYGEEHVRLPSFTKWATGLGWSVPPELHDMAADNGPSPPEPAVVEASPQPIRGKKAKLPIPASKLKTHMEAIKSKGGPIPAADSLLDEVIAAFPKYRVTRDVVRKTRTEVWGWQPPGRRRKDPSS